MHLTKNQKAHRLNKVGRDAPQGSGMIEKKGKGKEELVRIKSFGVKKDKRGIEGLRGDGGRRGGAMFGLHEGTDTPC